MMIVQLYRRFRSFGGMRLLKVYAQMGVLWPMALRAISCLLHGRSLKRVYAVVNEKVAPLLMERYGHLVVKEQEPTLNPQPLPLNPQPLPLNPQPPVWFCWLQGLEAAPPLVKKCYEQLCRYLPDYEVVVDASNYNNYISLPTHVVEKYRKGVIPPANFSDMLRLELLYVYGGTWIDASVYMTDPALLDNRLWIDQIMNSNLFMFRYYDKQKRFNGVGNWFIHARARHWAIRSMRDVLYAYWRDYDVLTDYYIMHHAFGMIYQRYPSVIDEMPRRGAKPSLYLGDKLADDFDEQWWQELTSHVCFNKLNYRKEKEAAKRPDSYYHHLMDTDLHS